MRPVIAIDRASAAITMTAVASLARPARAAGYCSTQLTVCSRSAARSRWKSVQTSRVSWVANHAALRSSPPKPASLSIRGRHRVGKRAIAPPHDGVSHQTRESQPEDAESHDRGPSGQQADDREDQARSRHERRGLPELAARLVKPPPPAGRHEPGADELPGGRPGRIGLEHYETTIPDSAEVLYKECVTDGRPRSCALPPGKAPPRPREARMCLTFRRRG